MLNSMFPPVSFSDFAASTRDKPKITRGDKAVLVIGFGNYTQHESFSSIGKIVLVDISATMDLNALI